MAERSRGFLVLLVLMVGGIVILAATNPDRQSFEAMLDSAVADSAEGVLDRITGNALVSIQKQNIIYRNYVLFSVVETRLSAVDVRRARSTGLRPKHSAVGCGWNGNGACVR